MVASGNATLIVTVVDAGQVVALMDAYIQDLSAQAFKEARAGPAEYLACKLAEVIG